MLNSYQTGTLTENRMTVCEGWFAGTKHNKAPAASDLSPDLLDHLRLGIAMNSKAFLVDSDTPGGRIGYVGSSTECALLLQLRGWGFDYAEIRTEHQPDVLQVIGLKTYCTPDSHKKNCVLSSFEVLPNLDHIYFLHAYSSMAFLQPGRCPACC